MLLNPNFAIRRLVVFWLQALASLAEAAYQNVCSSRIKTFQKCACRRRIPFIEGSLSCVFWVQHCLVKGYGVLGCECGLCRFCDECGFLVVVVLLRSQLRWFVIIVSS